MRPEDPSQLHRAFVLHRRGYGDTSLLLELFVEDRGLLPVIAKGAAKGRQAGFLQPFRPLLIGLAGRGEVRVLAGVDAGGPAIALAGRRLYCGFYLNELLIRLLGREDPHPGLFARYGAALEGLAAENEADCLRRFEVALLDELGYGLALTMEAETGSVIDGAGRYGFDPERGAVGFSGERLAVQGATLLALAGRMPFGEATRAEAKGLMQRALARHLGARPLKSRELFH